MVELCFEARWSSHRIHDLDQKKVPSCRSTFKSILYKTIRDCKNLITHSLSFKNWNLGFLVQWLRVWLAMQETLLTSLIWEDSTSSGATKPRHPSTEPTKKIIETLVFRTHTLQQKKPLHWEACTAQLESNPSLLQLEKACMRQWRPRRVKNNQLDFFLTKENWSLVYIKPEYLAFL